LGGEVILDTAVSFKKTCKNIFLYILVILACNACAWDPNSGKGTLRVQISERDLYLAVGEEGKFDATVTAENISNYTVTWISNNPSRVTVDQNGTVRGIAPTSSPVTITATATATSGNSSFTSSSSSGSVRVHIQRNYEELKGYVAFKGTTETVNFTNLNNNSIYLVKVNTSANAVAAADTGTVRAAFIEEPGNNSTRLLDAFEADAPLPLMGHPGATAFNANPPPIDRAALHTQSAHSRSVRSFIPPAVGSTRIFWVEKYFAGSEWVQKQAVLMATGKHGNIWVMDKKLSQAQAQTLSKKFDIIYPAATNILGYEYGGGPGGNGGRDGDPKIQILVYDILNASGKDAGIAGYFWGKDFYDQYILNSWYGQPQTNRAEIFYVNANTVIDNPDWAYATLGHELQHMVHFNMKMVRYGLNSATWYNELLSAMTQDLIDASYLGISLDNPNSRIKASIPIYRSRYNWIGMTEWDGSHEAYATAVAFGAYLLRNYGGAKLLKKILDNEAVNIESLSLALNEISPGTDFESALVRFGEAMIFSGPKMPQGGNTFDKTVASTINGFTYTAFRFDLWAGGQPAVAQINDPSPMKPHSVRIHNSSAWRSKSGNFSITLERPKDPDIEFFLMVR